VTSEAGGAAAAAAPIPQAAMQDAAYARNWWRLVFDAERTSYASLLADVSVWGPNEAKLRAGDVVEVLDEQSTLFALLYLVEHVPAKSIRFAELITAPLGGRAVGGTRSPLRPMARAGQAMVCHRPDRNGAAGRHPDQGGGRARRDDAQHADQHGLRQSSAHVNAQPLVGHVPSEGRRRRVRRRV